jgi:Mrp family chromosome partitioning ATPase
MSTDTSQVQGSGLLRRTVRRRWGPLLGCAIVLAGLAVAYVGSTHATYTSSAEVLIRPLEGNAFSPSSLLTAQEVTVGLTTEANLVGSPPVMKLAAEETGSPVRADDNADGSIVLNSQIVRVSYSASTPGKARAGADAVARAFLDFRRSAAERLRDAEINRLQTQIDTTSKTLADATVALDKPNPPAGSAARAQVLTTRLAGLQQSLGVAQAQQTQAGSLVVPASSPGHVQALRPLVLAVLAALAVLLAALGIACWRTWVDDPVAASDRTVAALPVWASLPSPRALTSRGRARRRKLVAEHYRRLRTVLVAHRPAPCVLTLAGMDESDDLGEIAANLGACLRVGGFDTTLVDCDLRSGSLGALFGLHDEPGLCDLLVGEADPGDSPATGRGVRVIPLGSGAAHADDLVAGHAFDDLVADLLQRTGYLVLVTPSLGSAVGLRCASLSDAVLVVAREGRTARRDVEDVVARAALAPETARGVLIARLRPARRLLPRRRWATGTPAAHRLNVIEPLRFDEAEKGAGAADVEVGKTA